MESAFIVNSLKVCVESREVVKDFSVVIRPGEIHALMGANGSGKSSLAYAIAGNPEYHITKALKLVSLMTSRNIL